ncbi:hypothetical protein SADUNF_Sadunf03G0006400 [Salix dunnii]|uniref:Uncharacterized protein n=1 Tax=Salix dunnii TaxID=1413687 RepID=A0A835KAJ5_9ROSI|nr:hypothetical protein SADUNF_Sadunf03G0006400 [Salix dunnii]
MKNVYLSRLGASKPSQSHIASCVTGLIKDGPCKKLATKAVGKSAPSTRGLMKPHRFRPGTVNASLHVVKKPWPVKDDTYEEEDSEETEEEDHDNAEDGWRYGRNEDDDKETEDED